MRFPLFRSNRPVPPEYRSTFLHLYWDVIWFGILAGSGAAFVTVYAARLGANPLQLGLITAGPGIINLIFTLPSGRWLEKRPVGPATFWSAFLSRLGYLAWLPLPLLLPPQGQILALILLILLMSIPGTMVAIGFNALFADVVPPEWRGHVVGIRNAWLSLMLIVSSLISGLILNGVPFPTGYQIVFGLGFIGAAMSCLHVGLIVRQPRQSSPGRVGRSLGDYARPGWVRSIGDSFRTGQGLRFLTRAAGASLVRPDILRGPFGRILLLLFAFHLSQYLAVPVLPLYWVNSMHLSDWVISLGTAITHTCVFLGSTRLAYLVQKWGNRRLTALGVMGMCLYPMLMGLSQGLGLFLAACILGGFTWALVNGALGNYLLENVPADNRPAYLAWYNLALNAAILLGSLAGPLLAGQIGLSTALVLFGLSRLVVGVALWRWG
jgi:MFS family permease